MKFHPKRTQTHHWADSCPDTVYANILFKYVDRLSDPTDEDPLELIVSQMLTEVAEESSGL